MMLSESNKHGCTRLPPDLLSDLPENVINDILMRFPLQEAVKTSILSKKWRYKWCRLPQLKLDDDKLWWPTDNLVSPSIKFTNIMYRILTLHLGPLTKFALSMSELTKYPKPKIDSLIYFLSRNDIQHLVLKFSQWNQYTLPSSFFACTKLTHLALQNCVICHPLSFEGFDMLVSLELCNITITSELLELPSSFVACTKLRHFSLQKCIICPTPSFEGFDMLISLELSDVTLSSELLESLISYSPLLEKLVLRISERFGHIQIKALKLRSFEFRGWLGCLSLENVPLLAKLSVFYCPSFVTSEKCDLDKFFRSLPVLEHLYLDELSVKMLIAGAVEVPRRLSSPLYYLKRLNIFLDTLADLSCTFCLIRSSPYLRDLELEVRRIGYQDNGKPLEPLATNVVDEVISSFSDVTLNYLRTVELVGVKGFSLEMRLVKLLLTKSPMLVKMLIKPNSGLHFETRDKILAEIAPIQRASCKAEVVVFDEYEEYRGLY